MAIKRGLTLSFGLWAALAPPLAHAEEPLSAIDWLSQSVTQPAAANSTASETPVTAGAVPAEVSVSVIGAPSPDVVGLLPPKVTGLPAKLWGPGKRDDIVALIRAEHVDSLPALRGLFLTLLLAESEPPADAGQGGTLLTARIDKLLDLGALDQARALLDTAGSRDANLFRRSFDVALLTGDEDRGCRVMVESPGLAPTFPARIFCLARSGDWNAAALTLRTAQALGYVTDAEDALLSRFLDPDQYEGDQPLETPARVTPLDWRMFEAIGEPLPTATLPLAFAHAELRPNVGWKSRLEAAERLARAGALPANALLGLYTEQAPAASGGVWDRVAAFQKFDAAMTAQDRDAIAAALPDVWAKMAEAELEVPFADLFGATLNDLALSGEAGRVAFAVALLSPDYAKARIATPNASDRFLMGLAAGNVAGLTAPNSLALSIAPAFAADIPKGELAGLMDQGRMGEALLLAIDHIERGVRGDLGSVTEGLALLRLAGMERIARRTALELMLLERRG